MSVSRVQPWIDQLWLVSWQRWAFIATAIVAACASSTTSALAAGHQTAPVFVFILALAIVAVITPDSHTALVLEAIAVWQWLASTDDATSAWVIPMALWLFLFHTVIALMAVTPISADVDRSVLLRWGRRSMLVAVATVGVWVVAFVLSERRAPGNAALTLLGFVTLTALIVVTLRQNTTAQRNTARSTPPH